MTYIATSNDYLLFLWDQKLRPTPISYHANIQHKLVKVKALSKQDHASMIAIF